MYQFRLTDLQMDRLERNLRRLLEDYDTVGYEDVAILNSSPSEIQFEYSVRDIRNVATATVQSDGGVTISGFPSRMFPQETLQLENMFVEYVVDTAAPQAPQAPQPIQPIQPIQHGGSHDIGTLRSLCNQRGLSCRDSRGRFLSRNKLLQLLN